MKSLAALLILGTLASASDEKPEISWTYGLESACQRAAKKNRLILLRQVHCDCDGTNCPLIALARRPAYLESVPARLLIKSQFVPAVVHAPKKRDVGGLAHPSFLPEGFRRETSQVRTLIVTPTGQVIHRFDLCPHAGEAEVELVFAQKARTECFTEAWAPVAGWEARLQNLHADHALAPESWHAALLKGLPAERGMRPWANYAKIHLVWQADLAAAIDVARKSERLLFFYQVVGNLDKEGC